VSYPWSSSGDKNMAAVHHSSLSKEIRERLGLWDGKENCLAPLTEAQKNSVAELTAVSSSRALPSEVSYDRYKV